MLPRLRTLQMCIGHLDAPQAIWRHAFEQQLSRSAANLLLVFTSLPTEVASDESCRCLLDFPHSPGKP